MHSHYKIIFFAVILTITSLFSHTEINNPHHIPVVIVGSGPSGLSAAIYTARHNIPTIVFVGEEPGGQLTHASKIENWPGRHASTGIELMHDLEEQAQHFGAVLVPATIERIDCDSWPFTLYTDDDEVYTALTVIMATGGLQEQLNLPEASQLWKQGRIKSCSVCDAPYEKDKQVVVIGNNDMAVDKVIHIADYADHVTFIVYEQKSEITAQVLETAQELENVTILFNTKVTHINAFENNMVLELINKTTQEIQTLSTESLYVSLGTTPNSTLLPQDLCDEQGYIVCGTRHQTAVQGLFAAGNVEDKYYQKAGVAAGRGIEAGLDVIGWLKQHNYSNPLLRDQRWFALRQQQPTYTTITNAQELHEQLQKNSLVLLEFYKTACPNCMRMNSIIDATASKYGDGLTILKAQWADALDLAGSINFVQVPTLIFFKNGKKAHQTHERLTKRELYQIIDELL